MSRINVLLILVAVSGVSCNMSSEGDPPEGHSRAAGWGLPVAPPPRNTRSNAWEPPESAGGVVTASDGDTLTIRCGEGYLREFRAGAWLGTKYPRRGAKYRFDQVHVGDEVVVGYENVDKVSVAQNLSIRRRPGGTIPVEPWTSESESWPWHLSWQLRMDAADRGVPVPRFPGRDECPWVVNGQVVPTRTITDYLFEKERQNVARAAAEWLGGRKSLFEIPNSGRMPGTLPNGVELPEELLYKAVLEKEGSLRSPPPTPVKPKQ